MFAIILAVVAYFSGAKSFSKAYIHVFTLFSVVNIYDMIVLDIGLFCHSKKLEYLVQRIWIKNIEVHGIGTIIGAVVALLSGGMVHFISII